MKRLTTYSLQLGVVGLGAGMIGLALSRDALATVGVRPMLLGILLWVVVAAISLPLAMWTA